MAVPTAAQIALLNTATCNNLTAVAMGTLLSKLDISDGTYRGPINMDTLGDTFTMLGGAWTSTPFSIGTQADTSGSGIAITSTVTGAGKVFSDDGGASIADSVRGLQSRFLLTVDQTGGSIRALQGQLKLLSLADVTTGIYTALQGYVELVGTHIVKTGATFSCADLSLEITTALTVDSGGEAFGLHIETTGAGTITDNGSTYGKCAAIGITKASGAASWPVGLQIPAAGVIQGIRVGEFATGGSVTAAGVVFSTAGNFYSDGQVSAVSVFGATNSDLGAGYHVTCGRFRHMVQYTSVAAETYGLVGQLVVKSSTLTHMHAGLMGTLEGHTSGVVFTPAYDYSIAAVIARIGGGAAITATTPIAGFSAVLNGADVASGSLAAFAATSTGAGQWTWGLTLGDCDEAFNFLTTGACVDAHGVGSIEESKQILVSIDGSPYSMAVYAVGT